ncbi:MAG: hypothetical protein AAGB00_07550 [Planctomycetota bacterium]
MPRYVLLRHECPDDYRDGPHWDLMLEDRASQTLCTWSLLELPSAWRVGDLSGGGAAVAAERLPDHRLRYLDYEGGISGGRGRVERVAAGTFEGDPTLGDPTLGDPVTIEAAGDLAGAWRLEHRAGATWRLEAWPPATG